MRGDANDSTAATKPFRNLDRTAGASCGFVCRGADRAAADGAKERKRPLGEIQVSVQYQAVGWNRQKKIYDSVLMAGVVSYLAIFTGAGVVIYPTATAETLLIRAFGTLALCR